MIETPERLYTRQADIARLEALAQELQDEAIVEVLLADGRRLRGVVSTRPILQLFRDAEGQEGFNAVLRIDDDRHPETAHYLWMDQVLSVVHLGSA